MLMKIQNKPTIIDHIEEKMILSGHIPHTAQYHGEMREGVRVTDQLANTINKKIKSNRA